jgi:hypothetical protein
MYVAGGSVTLRLTTVTSNSALAGSGRPLPHQSPGVEEGGGLYLDGGASVGLDSFTQAHVSKNKASTAYPDIAGSWTPIT